MKSKLRKNLMLLVLSLALVVGLVPVSQVKAVNTGGADAYTTLIKQISNGTLRSTAKEPEKNYGTNTYKCSGGGYKTYMEITKVGTNHSSNGNASTGVSGAGTLEVINPDVFETLTVGAKQAYLKDVMRIANREVQHNAEVQDTGITTDTVNQFLESIQNKTGMGSQLLASLLSETQPDYAKANQIYKPFSGPIGVVLGLISILIMALLGVTMALDLAYIVIPAFQLMMSGEGGDGNGQGAKGIAKIISVEARNAVQAAEGGGGAGGQNGSGNKMAVGLYFKARWKGLLVLGICLLYLVQGQIYSLVAMIIDLVSGFLGF